MMVSSSASEGEFSPASVFSFSSISVLFISNTSAPAWLLVQCRWRSLSLFSQGRFYHLSLCLGPYLPVICLTIAEPFNVINENIVVDAWVPNRPNMLDRTRLYHLRMRLLVLGLLRFKVNDNPFQTGNTSTEQLLQFYCQAVGITNRKGCVGHAVKRD
jgi:hypothetical protein